MRQLFEQKINIIRTERPVVLLNVQELAEEKIKSGEIGGITFEDLRYSISHSLTECSTAKHDERGLYPVISSLYIQDGKKDLKNRIDIPADDTNAELDSYKIYRKIVDNFKITSGASSDFFNASAYTLFKVLNKKWGSI